MIEIISIGHNSKENYMMDLTYARKLLYMTKFDLDGSIDKMKKEFVQANHIETEERHL